MKGDTRGCLNSPKMQNHPDKCRCIFHRLPLEKRLTYDKVREEIRRLRREGKSIRLIMEATKMSMGSVTHAIKDIDISGISIQRKKALEFHEPHSPLLSDIKMPPPESPAFSEMSREHKARIAEAAIFFRLVVHGFTLFGSLSDASKADWVVDHEKLKTPVRVQVKWVGFNPSSVRAQGSFRGHCAEGRNCFRFYRENEADFIVGYVLWTDTAYVYRRDEITTIHDTTVSPEHAERWDKILT